MRDLFDTTPTSAPAIDLSPSAQIISASRRTDIPAFYTRWLLQRLREGFVDVVNPFNPRQVQRVSLQPQHVIAIVFWTRNPRPLLPHLDWLREQGYRFYFQWTLNRYPAPLEISGPNWQRAVDAFHEFARRLSPDHLQWRYDPILFSNITPPEWHLDNFAELAEQLRGATRRCYVSFTDFYRKTRRNLEKLDSGLRYDEPDVQQQREFVRNIQKIAAANNIELYACCEDHLLDLPGIRKARCVDIEIIGQLYPEVRRKVPVQSTRPQCGCVQSKDIGAYDSCLFRCTYCYANASFETRSLPRFKKHDPNSPMLIPA